MLIDSAHQEDVFVFVLNFQNDTSLFDSIGFRSSTENILSLLHNSIRTSSVGASNLLYKAVKATVVPFSCLAHLQPKIRISKYLSRLHL
jgi:hypothetical protein